MTRAADRILKVSLAIGIGFCVLVTDEQASLIAQRMELNVRAFPGNVQADRSKRAHANAWEPPSTPLQRNKAMVKRAHLVIAAPDGPEKPRSATWATIRMANTQGKKIYVVEP